MAAIDPKSVEESSGAKGVITFNPPNMRTSPLYDLVAQTRTPQHNLVVTAGQIGALPDGSVPADPVAQVQQALINLEKCLTAAGARKHDILKLTYYVVDYDHKHTWPAQREVVSAWLQGARPPTTLVPVVKLARPEFLFEVEAMAAVPYVAPSSVGAEAAWIGDSRGDLPRVCGE